MKARAGRMIWQPEGYSAFIPASLPPDPPLRFDSQLATILATAGTALGRLDGVSATLPNPELFVAMYVRHEAVLSSQIEGTQSTLDDVLTFEIDSDHSKLPGDIEEVVNYVNAMNYGLARLERYRSPSVCSGRFTAGCSRAAVAARSLRASSGGPRTGSAAAAAWPMRPLSRRRRTR